MVRAHAGLKAAAALAKGVPEELFDRVVIPIALTRPGSAEGTPLDRDA
jgi:hypothetical protein